jgi:hypothetical protein
MQTSSCTIYIPAVPVAFSSFPQSYRRVPLAMRDAPEQVCGAAMRVGSTGSARGNLALYRLKLKLSFAKSLTTATLPGFYIIEDGIFIEYQG